MCFWDTAPTKLDMGIVMRFIPNAAIKLYPRELRRGILIDPPPIPKRPPAKPEANPMIAVNANKMISKVNHFLIIKAVRVQMYKD